MFDYRSFKEAGDGKPFREWQDGEHKGILAFSRKSALEPDGKVVGLHVIASYEEVMVASIPTALKISLFMRALTEFYIWFEASGLPGQVAIAQQDMPWGTQPTLHIHFYVAEVEEMKKQGYKPRRLVDPMSRLEPIAI